MQINPRQSRVGPPSFRKPITTPKADQERRKARDIAFFGSVAGQLVSLTDKMVEARAQDQYATAITNATEQLNNLELKYAQDPDYATHTERYTQDVNLVRSDILNTLDNDRAQQYFNKWWDAHEESYRMGIEKNAMLAEARHMQYRLEKVNLPKAARGDNSEGQAEIAVKSLIAGALAAGHVTQEGAESLETYWLHQIDVTAISKDIQGLMYSEGLEKARAYLYSDATDSLSADDIDNIAKTIDQYETQIFDKEIGRVADLFYNDDGNIGVTHDMIDASKLPNRGNYSKTYWHKELNKALEDKRKDKRDESETAEYTQAFDTAFNEAGAVDVRKPKKVDAFNASLEKTILKDGDKDDIRRIVNDKQATYKIEQKEIEETEKEEQERLRNKDYVRAYEGIRTGAITGVQDYRNKDEYPHLDEKEDWAKLDKALDDKQKPVVRRSNPDTLTWLSQHWDNPDIDNKPFEDYVIRNRENLAGEKYGDYKTWLNRARTRDVTKTDPAKKPAITIINEAFKDLDSLSDEVSEKTKLQKEKALVAEDYTRWLEDNLDADYSVKIQKAEEMVNGFRKSQIPKVLDELIERREVRAGTLGLDQLLEKTAFSAEQIKTGKDANGYLVYGTPDGKRYRYNTDKDRLEYYDTDKGKWKKAK